MSCWTFKIKPISPKVSINATVRFPAQAVFRRRFYGGSMSIFVAIFPITSGRHICKSNLTVCGSFSASYWTTRSIRANNILKHNHNGCRRFKSPQQCSSSKIQVVNGGSTLAAAFPNFNAKQNPGSEQELSFRRAPGSKFTKKHGSMGPR